MCEPEQPTHANALIMFRESIKEEHWYFFAVTGLNITQKLIKSLTQGDFDEEFLKYFHLLSSPAALNHIIERFYYIIFKLFNDRWVKARPNIMEFTQFFDQVYHKDFMPHYSIYLQDVIRVKGTIRKL